MIASAPLVARLRSDRLAAVHLVRCVAALLAVLAVGAVPTVGSAGWPTTSGVAAWLAVTSVAEVARRRHRGAAPVVAAAMLALDAVVLADLIARTGGSHSPLVGLVYLHVAAVSLLASYRVAIRLAAWHGIVQFAAFVLAAAGVAGLELPDGLPTPVAGRIAAIHAVGFIVVAVALAAFGAMNDAAVRRSQLEVAALAAVGRATGPATTIGDALAAGAEALGGVLGADVEASTAPPPAPGTSLLRRHGDRTNVVVVPLPLDEGEEGSLRVAFGGGPRRRVAASTLTAVEQAAAIIASAATRARLHARIEELAAIDPLTGVANRRAFEEALDREVLRSRRTGEPFSLVVVDVDHFKRVNDSHGHDTGDEVLRHVARSVAGAVRASDFVARFGGEEFVALLPGCGSATALAVADGIRWAVSTEGSPVPVTASAGVATFPDQAADAAELFRAADGALYRAKERGRDRTVQAPRTQRPTSRR